MCISRGQCLQNLLKEINGIADCCWNNQTNSVSAKQIAPNFRPQTRKRVKMPLTMAPFLEPSIPSLSSPPPIHYRLSISFSCSLSSPLFLCPSPIPTVSLPRWYPVPPVWNPPATPWSSCLVLKGGGGGWTPPTIHLIESILTLETVLRGCRCSSGTSVIYWFSLHFYPPPSNSRLNELPQVINWMKFCVVDVFCIMCLIWLFLLQIGWFTAIITRWCPMKCRVLLIAVWMRQVFLSFSFIILSFS